MPSKQNDLGGAPGPPPRGLRSVPSGPPARHLGTALFDGLVGDAWVSGVGPVVGEAIAALVSNQFIPDEDE